MAERQATKCWANKSYPDGYECLVPTLTESGLCALHEHEFFGHPRPLEDAA